MSPRTATAPGRRATTPAPAARPRRATTKGGAGAVFLYTFAVGEHILLARFFGDDEGARLGQQALFAGDWNQDGADELVLDAPASDGLGFLDIYLSSFPVGAVLDVRPAGCPNPLNPGSQGVLPVALVAEPGLPVSSVALASLRLEGEAPVHIAFEDVSSPGGGESCAGGAPDGVVDLMLHFRTSYVVEALEARLGRALEPGEEVEGSLSGVLVEELGGNPLSASDVVVVRGGGRGPAGGPPGRGRGPR